MLAASYATERDLKFTPLVADFKRFPVDAPERRDGVLVAMADAAVIVWDDRDPVVRRVLQLVEAKGIPVHVIGAPENQKVKCARGPEEPSHTRRGLPVERVADSLAFPGRLLEWRSECPVFCRPA